MGCNALIDIKALNFPLSTSFLSFPRYYKLSKINVTLSFTPNPKLQIYVFNHLLAQQKLFSSILIHTTPRHSHALDSCALFYVCVTVDIIRNGMLTQNRWYYPILKFSMCSFSIQMKLHCDMITMIAYYAWYMYK